MHFSQRPTNFLMPSAKNVFGWVRSHWRTAAFTSPPHEHRLPARSAGLPYWLVTWHSQTRPITTPPALPVSRENIKVRKLFELPSCVYIYIGVSSVHLHIYALTLYLLMWRIWSAPNNASKGQMGFNLAFKGLIIVYVKVCFPQHMVCFINK